MSDSMKPKFMKFTTVGYENYSGPIGQYEFIDGISVDMIPRVDRDRLATAFNFVEIAENGNETEAGIAARMASEERKIEAEVFVPSERQTEEEKISEQIAIIESDAAAKRRPILTKEELETVFTEGGIAALREVGDAWKVKNRSPVVLMQMILDQQALYLETDAGKLQQKLAEVIAALPDPVSIDAAQDADTEVPGTDVEQAAISGDLGATLTVDPEKVD